MSIQARGGVPRFVGARAIGASGDKIAFEQLSMHVKVRVSADAKLFVSQANMEADKDGFPVTPTLPYDAPHEDGAIFIKGDAGAVTVDVAYYCRKG